MSIGTATVGNNREFLQKLKTKLPYFIATLLLDIYLKGMKSHLKRCETYLSIIYLISYDKEGSYGIYDNMEGLWGHYDKWSKSVKDIYSTISLINGF